MVALEEGRNLIDGGETNKERQENLQHLQKEASQLANYFFVYQSLIFTTFYNAPSALKCRYHWIPFVLSLLAGVLNLGLLTKITFKYKRVLDDIDRNVIWAATAADGGDRVLDDTEPAVGAVGALFEIVECFELLGFVFRVFCHHAYWKLGDYLRRQPAYGQATELNDKCIILPIIIG